jgi:hypothetical protein
MLHALTAGKHELVRKWRRDETTLQMAMPCLSTYHCMTSCSDCTVTEQP